MTEEEKIFANFNFTVMDEEGRTTMADSMKHLILPEDMEHFAYNIK